MAPLLLVGCSGRKHTVVEATKAFDLYDGVSYRLLKKARREKRWPTGMQVAIVSAKYGLLRQDTLVESYDQRMDKRRAVELRSQVSAGVDALLDELKPDHLCISMGSIYHMALADSVRLREGVNWPMTMVYTRGGIGVQLGQLRDWVASMVVQVDAEP